MRRGGNWRDDILNIWHKTNLSHGKEILKENLSPLPFLSVFSSQHTLIKKIVYARNK